MRSLRKGIDCLGVSLIFFCHDGKGNFVLAKRGAAARDENGRWEVGGGAVELGDTIDETLKREVLEEYCTDVLDYEFLGYRDVHRVHNGEKTHWIGLDFKILVDPAKVKNGEPHKLDEVAWFTLDTLPRAEELHSEGPKFFKKYKDKL